MKTARAIYTNKSGVLTMVSVRVCACLHKLVRQGSFYTVRFKSICVVAGEAGIIHIQDNKSGPVLYLTNECFLNL